MTVYEDKYTIEWFSIECQKSGNYFSFCFGSTVV